MGILTQERFLRIMGLTILTVLGLLILMHLSDALYGAWLVMAKHKIWSAVALTSFTVLYVTITEGE